MVKPTLEPTAILEPTQEQTLLQLRDVDLVDEIERLISRATGTRARLSLVHAMRLAFRRQIALPADLVETMGTHTESSIRHETAVGADLTPAQALALLEDPDGWVRGAIVRRYGDALPVYDPSMWERLVGDDHPGVVSALQEQEATPGTLLERTIQGELERYESGDQLSPMQQLRFQKVAEHPNCPEELIARFPVSAVRATVPERLAGPSTNEADQQETYRRVVTGLCRDGFDGPVSAARALAGLVTQVVPTEIVPDGATNRPLRGTVFVG